MKRTLAMLLLSLIFVGGCAVATLSRVRVVINNRSQDTIQVLIDGDLFVKEQGPVSADHFWAEVRFPACDNPGQSCDWHSVSVSILNVTKGTLSQSQLCNFRRGKVMNLEYSGGNWFQCQSSY
jgi:hypothetical protein